MACQFCHCEKTASGDLYTCPRCDVRYCSLSCYKNPKHSSCSESFYRQWVQSETNCSSIDSASNSRTTDDVVFAKKEKSNRPFAGSVSFSVKDAEEIGDETLDGELQRLGIADPNDVEELLDELTDQEKERFLKMVSETNLETGEMSDRVATSASIHDDDNFVQSPWWHRCNSLVVTETVLADDLAGDAFYSDMFSRVENLQLPERVASTICYNIVNALAAYCLVLRELQLKSFWLESNINEYHCIQATNRILDGSCSLSGSETFSSADSAVVSVLYKLLPDEKLRPILKRDVIIILKNRDWRKDGRKPGQYYFASLALCDMVQLFTRARTTGSHAEERKNLFRICKKLDFYLKWSETNGSCWQNIAAELEATV